MNKNTILWCFLSNILIFPYGVGWAYKSLPLDSCGVILLFSNEVSFPGRERKEDSSLLQQGTSMSLEEKVKGLCVILLLQDEVKIYKLWK